MLSTMSSCAECMLHQCTFLVLRACVLGGGWCCLEVWSCCILTLRGEAVIALTTTMTTLWSLFGWSKMAILLTKQHVLASAQRQNCTSSGCTGHAWQ